MISLHDTNGQYIGCTDWRQSPETSGPLKSSVSFSVWAGTALIRRRRLYCSAVSASLSSMMTRSRRLLFSCCNSVILVFYPVRTHSTIRFTKLWSWLWIASVTYFDIWHVISAVTVDSTIVRMASMSDSSRRICAIGSDWIPSAMVGEKAQLF